VSIDDTVIRTLMLAYHDQLARGGGRSEALREQQPALLARPETAHPYYWASFIASGSGAALDGTPVSPSFARVTPGMRSCGCELGPRPEPGPDPRGPLLAAAALVASQRRRSRSASR
jgi:hypothetical protein